VSLQLASVKLFQKLAVTFPAAIPAAALLRMLDHALRDQGLPSADPAVTDLLACDLLRVLCIPEVCKQLDPRIAIASGVNALQFCGALPCPLPQHTGNAPGTKGVWKSSALLASGHRLAHPIRCIPRRMLP
jgi:hypothetical protein